MPPRSAPSAHQNVDDARSSTFTTVDRPIESITPYARNPRHNAPAIAAVAASIKEFGWRQPIVVDAHGVVIVGHTRLLAAQALGYTTVPVHVAETLTPAQVKALRLADNRVGENAKWLESELALELNDLRLDGFNLDLTGFNATELSHILDGASTWASDIAGGVAAVDEADAGVRIVVTCDASNAAEVKAAIAAVVVAFPGAHLS